MTTVKRSLGFGHNRVAKSLTLLAMVADGEEASNGRSKEGSKRWGREREEREIEMVNFEKMRRFEVLKKFNGVQFLYMSST